MPNSAEMANSPKSKLGKTLNIKLDKILTRKFSNSERVFKLGKCYQTRYKLSKLGNILTKLDNP